jgi:hypothetical protein
MGLLAFFLAWFAYDVAIRTDTLVIWSHVKQGGCLDDFNTAMDRCRYDKHPDAEKCIMATAALRRQQGYGNGSMSAQTPAILYDPINPSYLSKQLKEKKARISPSQQVALLRNAAKDEYF